MPTSSKTNRRGGNEDKGKMGTLMEKSASFHGHIPGTKTKLRRPKTHPELPTVRNIAETLPETQPRFTKLLLNVTIQRSLGAVHVMMSPESTVGDIIAATVKLYAKEGRRPFLLSTEASGFDLHYSQFSLESLDREAKVIGLGSRNFFLCPKKSMESGDGVINPPLCSKEAEKASEVTLPWLSFMGYLL